MFWQGDTRLDRDISISQTYLASSDLPLSTEEQKGPSRSTVRLIRMQSEDLLDC